MAEDVGPPEVAMAPMAGVTNRAFRQLCREYGPGLLTSEMITARALVEGNEKTRAMLSCPPGDTPRSVQLAGVDAATIAAAVRLLVAGDLVDHIDLNMGCPVPKITRRGGGAALPWKRDLFADIVQAAVGAARVASRQRRISPVPVSVKLRLGIDGDHLTFRDAGRLAAGAGVAWVTLHARTAEQRYGGRADWRAIGTLVDDLAPLGVPVIGNGDIWTAGLARRMRDETGCAGVALGRGCLGRPWLFGQVHAASVGAQPAPEPGLGEVVAAIRRHADLLVEFFGEARGCRELRKHVAWYLKGYVIGPRVRAALGLVESREELGALLDQINLDQAVPVEVVGGPRGRTGGEKAVALPTGWLLSRSVTAGDLAELEVAAGLGFPGG